MLEVCIITINEYQTQVALNMLPLVSSDVFIVMDQLEAWRVNLDCYHKALEYVDTNWQLKP